MATVAIVGGTSGLGLEIARHYADRGHQVLITGRDSSRAKKVAAEIGPKARGLGVDLARPEDIAAALADIDLVDSLVLTAIERDENTVADFDIAAARHLVTLKLVGYLTVVHTLRARLSEDASVL